MRVDVRHAHTHSASQSHRRRLVIINVAAIIIVLHYADPIRLPHKLLPIAMIR